MTLPPPIYDLVLLLDPQLEEPARAKIVADARAAIEADGELVRYDPWGERALAYPIARKASAEYHLFQFHPGTPRLLETLEHSLRIIDGILRFRIIKLKPGVPDAPDMRASAPPRRADAEPGQEQATAATPEAAAPQAPSAEPESSVAAQEQPPEAVPAPDPAATEAAAEVEVGERA
jgi:small subunit ribosomal protein S6